MSAELKGLDEALRQLDQRLGPQAITRISDDALKKAAKVFISELKRQVRTFSDKTGASKGYTYDEITMSEPMTVAGVRTIRVYWRGPRGRYRIIHLNEWGTIQNPNPRGKGAIARAFRNSKRSYLNEIRKAIASGL